MADLDLRDPSGGIQLSTGSSAHSVSGAGGIASGEAFGSPALSPAISGAGGIPSGEALGSPIVAPATSAHDITGAGGIGSAEAFGLAAVLAVAVLTGIPSAESFGSPLVVPVVQTIGIGSGEALGNPSVSGVVNTAGIPTEEAFGSPGVGAEVEAVGIGSAEAFGQPTVEAEPVAHEIEGAGGIEGGEAFGSSLLSVLIDSPGGIPSGESFGAPSVSVPVSITGAGAIGSAEAFGSPAVVKRYRGLRVSGYVKVTGRLYVSDQIETSMIHITPHGGFAVKLRNQTGSTLKHGTAVSASPDHDGSVVPQSSEFDCIGAVYMDIPDGEYGWVVTTGIAEFLLKDGTSATRGYWAKAADTDGRIVVTTAPSGVGALTTSEHFREIGHCVESKSAGTNVLVKILLHFL